MKRISRINEEIKNTISPTPENVVTTYENDGKIKIIYDSTKQDRVKWDLLKLKDAGYNVETIGKRLKQIVVTLNEHKLGMDEVRYSK